MPCGTSPLVTVPPPLPSGDDTRSVYCGIRAKLAVTDLGASMFTVQVGDVPLALHAPPHPVNVVSLFVPVLGVAVRVTWVNCSKLWVLVTGSAVAPHPSWQLMPAGELVTSPNAGDALFAAGVETERVSWFLTKLPMMVCEPFIVNVHVVLVP